MRWLAGMVLAMTFTGFWNELGGSGSGAGVSSSPTFYSAYPSLAIDSKGLPWIAWEERNFDGHWIYLRHWTGSAWEGVGGSDTGSGVSPDLGNNETPALALDSSDRPVVAWSRIFGISVARWTGTSWFIYPQPFTWPDDNGTAFRVKVRLDALDRPIVVWEFAPTIVGNDSLPNQVYLKRWTGSAWEELGGSASGTGISNALYLSEHPDLALDGTGNPVVAWTQRDSVSDGVCILVKRWNGTSWVDYGGSGSVPGISGGLSNNASIALDPSGNPVVAWNEGYPPANLSGDIYLRKWNGTAWVELGGSATGGGISAAADGARYPSLAVGSTGHPTVAWQNGPPYTTDEIYIRRWNGSGWTELAGSASGGGVSGTSAVSSGFASLALTPAGDPGVAWTEGFSNITPSNPEIFYRQLGETSNPSVLQVTAMTPAKKQDDPPKEMTLSLSAAPDPLTVNAVSIQMIYAGKDEIFGTGDDREIFPRISVTAKTITLDLRGLKLAKGYYRLLVRGTDDYGYAGAVRDALGRILDGEFGGTFPSGNGVSGGNFQIDLDFGATPPGQR